MTAALLGLAGLAVATGGFWLFSKNREAPLEGRTRDRLRRRGGGGAWPDASSYKGGAR